MSEISHSLLQSQSLKAHLSSLQATPSHDGNSMMCMSASRGRRIERSTSTGGFPASFSRSSARTPQRRMAPAFPRSVHHMRLRSHERVEARDEANSPLHVGNYDRFHSCKCTLRFTTSYLPSCMKVVAKPHSSTSFLTNRGIHKYERVADAKLLF